MRPEAAKRMAACCVAAALASCATARPAPAPEPSQYLCTARAKGPFGEVSDTMWVSTTGEEPSHRVSWHSTPRFPGAGLLLALHADGPDLPEADWQVSVTIEFRTAEKQRRGVGLFIGEGGANVPVPVAARYRERGTRAWLIYGDMPWGQLRSRLRGGGTLDVLLARPDGTIVARDTIDPATLDRIAAAIAVVRPRAEAMAADFRTLCTVVPDIVVTQRIDHAAQGRRDEA